MIRKEHDSSWFGYCWQNGPHAEGYIGKEGEINVAKNGRGRSLGGEEGEGHVTQQMHHRQADKIDMAGRFHLSGELDLT